MFWVQKVHLFCSCVSLGKNVHVFALDPCLDWHLRGFLTTQPIYDFFKFQLKWTSKYKILLKCQFAKDLSTIQKLKSFFRCSNVSLANHQLTLNPYHWSFIVLYLPPIQCQKLLLNYIFLHLSANFWLKIQNTHHYRKWAPFWHLGNWHLMVQ